ncbi:MAG: hypothetical protein NC935_05740 [Candidatus Omnitrophica bacterium]|nr:hypothetical protein [Candidatus Omnitrophota bacterium]
MILNYEKKMLVENSFVIRVSNFIRKAINNLNEQNFKFDLRNENDVIKFKEIVEATTRINLIKKDGEKTIETKKNTIKLTYLSSNLKKGFIFFFICNNCGNRVRLLYIPPNSEDLFCRNCHRLSYEKQNKKPDKILKHLLINPQTIFTFKPRTLKEALSYYKAVDIFNKIKKDNGIDVIDIY